MFDSGMLNVPGRGEKKVFGTRNRSMFTTAGTLADIAEITISRPNYDRLGQTLKSSSPRG